MAKRVLIGFFLMISSVAFPGPSSAFVPTELSGTIDNIYNADFTTAARNINAYITAHPDDPAGYLLRGMLGEWDQVVNNKRKANNPAIQLDYERANDRALMALEKDPENVSKMVMLGNTYMYMAKKLVDDGHKMQGGFALKKAKELMLGVIAKEPENEDAYMALGVFNYFSANVPSGFKFLANLLGFNGDEAKGIDFLKRATERENLTRGDAGYLLVYIYDEKEKNYAEALNYNALLKQRYPNNPAFQYETGEIDFRQKKYADSRVAFDQYFAFCQGKPGGFCNNKYNFLAHYFIAWGYIEENNLAAAKPHLDIAVKINDGQYADRNVDLDLWNAMILQEAGDVAAAKSLYQKVVDNKSQNPQAAGKAIQALKTLGG